MAAIVNEKKQQEAYADDSSVSSGDRASDVENFIGAQISQENEHAVKFRTCSWQKVRRIHECCLRSLIVLSQTAALLFSEYICLAVMSFPWCARIRVVS